jgi:hypothetical protein
MLRRIDGNACFRSLAICLLITNQATARNPINADPRTFQFPADAVTFDANFEGGRLNDVVRKSAGKYQMVILPENEPINNSAWYAFRIKAESSKTITIDLTYQGGTHRYHPQLSTDRKNWQNISADRYQRDGDQITLGLDVGPTPVWISAQEMLGIAELDAWTDRIAQRSCARKSITGYSLGDRPMWQLTIGTGDPRYAVAIVGRQHPPEVTGSMALMEFVETIAGPGELARRFRRSFETAVFPLANPDGVAAGNWRHNLDGVDLNRDWGPFRQPETRAIRDAILSYQNDDSPRLALLLDFHSTHHDVFYVQSGDDPVWPSGFALHWLDALSRRMPKYTVRQQPSAGTRPLSKVWARRTMKVPAIIYEVGDATDRALIRTVARTSAEEMMRLLLDEADRKTTQHRE